MGWAAAQEGVREGERAEGREMRAGQGKTAYGPKVREGKESERFFFSFQNSKLIFPKPNFK
jgi:hypothetical protein